MAFSESSPIDVEFIAVKRQLIQSHWDTVEFRKYLEQEITQGKLKKETKYQKKS